MSELAELVKPQPVKEFLDEIYGNSWAYFPGHQRDFTHLINWDMLSSILANRRLDEQLFRVVRRGELVPTEKYTEEVTWRTVRPYHRLVFAKLMDELRNGATIAVDYIDQQHLPLSDLACALESELRAPVVMDLFVSFSAVPGFNNHWDDHDVFVIQVEGSKHWQISEPTRPWPLYRDTAITPMPDRPPVAELDIFAGDVLYVPHGWWHTVSATAEPSLHITIGIAPNTGLDLLNWLLDCAHANEVFRRRLPRFQGQFGRYDYLKEFRKSLNELIDSNDLLERYFSFADGTSRNRLRFHFPDILAENNVDQRKSSAIALSAARALVTYDESSLILVALGRKWKFPVRAENLIRMLISGNPLTVESVLSANVEFGESQILDVIFKLARAGVITILN